MEHTSLTNNKASDETGQRKDLRVELERFATLLDELKVQYEQFFMGLAARAPEREHKSIQRLLKDLMRAPFKTVETSYRLKMQETRYHTLNTYWQRVLKQREDGTYHRDIFKADLREKIAAEELYLGTAQGTAEKSMQELFRSYKLALEKQTGNKQNLNFEKFSKSLVQRAQEFKAKSGCEKVAFKVVLKDGKVAIQAKGK